MTTHTDTAAPPAWRSLLRLAPYAKPYSAWIIVSAISAVVQAGLAVGMAYLLKNLLDHAVAMDYEAFMGYFWQMIGYIIIDVTVMSAGSYADEKYSLYTYRDLRDHTIKHIQRLPMSYMESHHTGDLVSRLNNDGEKVFSFLFSITGLIKNPLLFIFAISYLLILSWQIVVAALVLLPIFAVISSVAAKPIERHSRALQESFSIANTQAQDFVSGIAMVKAFVLENFLSQRYGRAMQDLENNNMRLLKSQMIWGSLSEVLNASLTILLPLYGVYLVFQGALTVGGLLGCLALMGQIINPVMSLINMIKNIRETGPAAERIWEIVDHPEESLGTQPFVFQQQALPIEVSHVVFRYNRADDQSLEGKANLEGDAKSAKGEEENHGQLENGTILNDLSFSVPEGATVALVGASGAGKSTVLKLISGMYFPNRGTVSIHGNDMHQTVLSGIRERMALVTQDTYLFPTTVEENIRYGRAGASQNEIIEAARLANAHEFIEDLTEGYGTLVGERGIRLSGGQQQRIAIARAILKDAPILLLDEPTSALDTQAEALVEEALQRLMEHRTVLVVAHRLSTIKSADRALVLYEGRIVEQGHHDGLMAEDTLYKRLYLKQTDRAPDLSGEGVL